MRFYLVMSNLFRNFAADFGKKYNLWYDNTAK